MNLDAEGNTEQKTFLGASLSLFIYGIVLMYAIQQVIIMMEHKKIDMVSSTNEYHFEETDVFSENQGLKFAVAFTGYDNE